MFIDCSTNVGEDPLKLSHMHWHTLTCEGRRLWAPGVGVAHSQKNSKFSESGESDESSEFSVSGESNEPARSSVSSQSAVSVVFSESIV